MTVVQLYLFGARPLGTCQKNRIDDRGALPVYWTRSTLDIELKYNSVNQAPAYLLYIRNRLPSRGYKGKYGFPWPRSLCTYSAWFRSPSYEGRIKYRDRC